MYKVFTFGAKITDKGTALSFQPKNRHSRMKIPSSPDEGIFVGWLKVPSMADEDAFVKKRFFYLLYRLPVWFLNSLHSAVCMVRNRYGYHPFNIRLTR